MDVPAPQGHQLSRRAILQTGASALLGVAATAVLPGATQVRGVDIGGGSRITDEQFTPVIQSIPSPPRWFKGTDDRVHLVYELLLTNTIAVPVAVTAVEVVDAGRGATVATLRAEALSAAMSLLAGDDAPAAVLPPSTVGVVWFDLPFADQTALPSAIAHRVTIELPAEVAWPASITDTGGRAGVDLRPPVVLGPPLYGPRWVAAGSCCDGPHRRSFQAIDGRLFLSQRFAIDFNLLDLQGRIAADDLSVNANHAGYSQPVFAVADATAVDAVDRFPDQIEGDHYPITLENVTGNRVILDLGEGRFAFYAHLRPGTVAVRGGERVRRGQQIGELGNSGNSHGAHLHFHLMDGPSALAADGLPYEFDAFDLTGHTPPLEELVELYEAALPLPVDPRGAGPRRDALPLGGDVITFPGPTGGS
jgi:hypothetical protein